MSPPEVYTVGEFAFRVECPKNAGYSRPAAMPSLPLVIGVWDRGPNLARERVRDMLDQMGYKTVKITKRRAAPTFKLVPLHTKQGKHRAINS